jgi:hypothetical protein
VTPEAQLCICIRQARKGVRRYRKGVVDCLAGLRGYSQMLKQGRRVIRSRKGSVELRKDRRGLSYIGLQSRRDP